MDPVPKFRFAIVRGVPHTYERCIRPPDTSGDIDVALARTQHATYCETLRQLGLTLIEIDPDDRFPDCCFVEDTAIVVGDTAIITRMGAESRRGEEATVRECFRNYSGVHPDKLRGQASTEPGAKPGTAPGTEPGCLHPGWPNELHVIESPATIDGGDVLTIGDKVYIGLGERTNEAAVGQVRAILGAVEAGRYEVVTVELQGILHLKSACTHLGGDHILMLPGHFDPKIFKAYAQVAVPRSEAYAANCLSVNGTVIVSRGYPETRRLIEERGFETVEIDMSEFRRGQGSLTCLSKLF